MCQYSQGCFPELSVSPDWGGQWPPGQSEASESQALPGLFKTLNGHGLLLYPTCVQRSPFGTGHQGPHAGL